MYPVGLSDESETPAYVVLCDDDYNCLAKQVGEWIEKGYVPLGGMQVGIQTFAVAGDMETRFYQTMVYNEAE